MKQYKDYTQQEIDALYTAAPEYISDMLFSGVIEETVSTAKSRFPLHVDMLEPLRLLIVEVLLGICPAEKFGAELQTRLSLSQEDSIEVTAFIEVEIFSLLRKDLLESYTNEEDESSSIDPYREKVAEKMELVEELFAAPAAVKDPYKEPLFEDLPSPVGARGSEEPLAQHIPDLLEKEAVIEPPFPATAEIEAEVLPIETETSIEKEKEHIDMLAEHIDTELAARPILSAAERESAQIGAPLITALIEEEERHIALRSDMLPLAQSEEKKEESGSEEGGGGYQDFKISIEKVESAETEDLFRITISKVTQPAYPVDPYRELV